MKSTFRNLMRSIVAAALLSTLGCTVTRVSDFPGGPSERIRPPRHAKIVMLSLDQLKSCGYENDGAVANEEQWQIYKRQPHVNITFQPSRKTRVMGHQVAVSELLIPISEGISPAHILVRSRGRIRAFCKYDCNTCLQLQSTLVKLP